MICRRRKTPSCGAYTFLEIALALGIIAVVFATMIPVISYGSRERKLRDGMNAIGQYVREIRLQTEKTGREKTLVILPDALALREKEHLVPKVTLPVGVKFFMRYPHGEWAKADEQEWRIFSGGLVAPVSLRLEDGQAWIEVDFDFLTGGVAEERYAF